jgi:hypothetical protein
VCSVLLLVEELSVLREREQRLARSLGSQVQATPHRRTTPDDAKLRVQSEDHQRTISHRLRVPFSWPVTMYWSRAHQAATVAFDPEGVMVKRGSSGSVEMRQRGSALRDFGEEQRFETTHERLQPHD